MSSDESSAATYRKPFDQAWSELPSSVKTQVRAVIVMLGVFMFLAGFAFGVMI